MSGLDLIITITDRSKCELFINWFRGRDIPLVLTALGQGTATTEILDCLGLEASEKSVLFCLAPHSRCMVRRAARDLWLDVPGNGVLMTVPVSSIGGTKKSFGNFSNSTTRPWCYSQKAIFPTWTRTKMLCRKYFSR